MLVPRVDKKEHMVRTSDRRRLQSFSVDFVWLPTRWTFWTRMVLELRFLKKCLFFESTKKKTWCERWIERDFKTSLPDVEEWTEVKIRGRGRCSLYWKLHSAETRQNRGISLHIYELSNHRTFMSYKFLSLSRMTDTDLACAALRAI